VQRLDEDRLLKLLSSLEHHVVEHDNDDVEPACVRCPQLFRKQLSPTVVLLGVV
jgi:hypothetical protein